MGSASALGAGVPDESSGSQTDLEATVGFVWYFLSRYPGRSILMVSLLAGAGIAEGVGVVSILPVLEVAGGEGGAQSTVGQLVTGVVEALGASPTLPVLLGVIVAAMTIKAIFVWFAKRSVGYTTADVTADLRLDILHALLHARWEVLADKSTGELANSLGSEAQRASGAFRQAADVMANGILIIAYAGVSLLMSWRATIFAVLAGAVFLLVFNRLVALSQSAGRKQTDLLKSLTGRFVDTLSGLKAIKAMALEQYVFPLLESDTRQFSDAQKEQVIASETQRSLKEPVLTLFLALGILGLIALGETMSRVLVLSFIAYRLLGIIANLQARLQSVVVGESAFWSLREKLKTLTKQAETSRGSRTPPPLREGITFDSVSFSYGESPVVSNLDMFIPSGTFVALTGESGSGKTTIADLILGLNAPQSGNIYIDDIPLTDISLHKWRQHIGYVPQEPMLLHDTVFTNLTLGDPNFSREDAQQALDSADALDFVVAKPEGLDSIVGERGGKLSGGQRQRIALARALLRDPSLLILDEPTTALDPDTEYRICQTLSELPGSFTVLAISHQSAIQKVASVILHLSGGTVTQRDNRQLTGTE